MFGQLIPWLSSIGRITTGHPRQTKVAMHCTRCGEFELVYIGPHKDFDASAVPGVEDKFLCSDCRRRRA